MGLRTPFSHARYEMNVAPDAPVAPASIFILVHGSFVPLTRWTRPGSQLRVQMQEAMQEHGPIRFYEFVWRGALNSRWNNSHRLRILAGQELRRHLRAIQKEFPGVPMFLVGHSHGGNVLLYALRDASLRAAVAGVVTMATPLMDFRPRRFSNIVAPLCLTYAGLALGVVWCNWSLAQKLGPGLSLPAALGINVGAAALALWPGIAAWRGGWLQKLRLVVGQLQRRFAYIATPLIKDVPHFCGYARWDGRSRRLNMESMLNALPRFGFSQLLFNTQVVLFLVCMAAGVWRYGWLGLVGGFLVGAVSGALLANLVALLIMPVYVSRTLIGKTRGGEQGPFYGGESLLFHTVGKIVLRRAGDTYPLHERDFVRDYPVMATFEHNIYDQPQLQEDLTQWLKDQCAFLGTPAKQPPSTQWMETAPGGEQTSENPAH